MVSEDSHQYQKSRKNHKGIKVTLWLRKTRCKELLCAPALTQAALNRPQTKGLT
jgi:hypothetical protein